MNPDRLWLGDSGLNRGSEFCDRWFMTSPENMEKFASLSDKWEEYMGPGGSFPSSKQYGGLSSHFLVKHHAEQMGLIPQFKYTYGGCGRKPDDYNEVRRMMGND